MQSREVIFNRHEKTLADRRNQSAQKIDISTLSNVSADKNITRVNIERTFSQQRQIQLPKHNMSFVLPKSEMLTPVKMNIINTTQMIQPVLSQHSFTDLPQHSLKRNTSIKRVIRLDEGANLPTISNVYQ